MSFIVEDGTIVANANAYITVAEYKTYWADRGVTISDSDAVIQGKIVLATEYVDNFYKFWGEPTDPENQSLLFPRMYIRDNKKVLIGSNTIPVQLKNAICWLAKEVSTSNKDLSAKTETGIQSKRIGPVAVTYQSGYTQRYKQVDSFLYGLAKLGRAGLQTVS